jgi:hypothetical protein
MAHGYWVNVRAIDEDDNTEATGKVFIFSHGRSQEEFLEQEVECRDDYDVDWKEMRKTKRNGFPLADNMPPRSWGGIMSWSHDITEGNEKCELGSEAEYSPAPTAQPDMTSYFVAMQAALDKMGQ